ncbi:MAG: hypothetical protein WC223_13870 [Bacteroidales bacterium]
MTNTARNKASASSVYKGLAVIVPTAQWQAHAANRTSHPRPKFAARACHLQPTTFY